MERTHHRAAIIHLRRRPAGDEKANDAEKGGGKRAHSPLDTEITSKVNNESAQVQKGWEGRRRESRLAPMFMVELIVLAIACVALLSIFWSTITLGISPMPTGRKVKKEVLALVPEDLQGEVHELGAGWGTLAWAVARILPRAQVIAWERSPFPFLFCRLRLLVQPRPNLTLRFADFHHADLRQAKLVLAYLWTGAMTQLGPKFEAELSPGAIVLSHTFAWRGQEPEATRIASDLYRTPVYRYRIPA